MKNPSVNPWKVRETVIEMLYQSQMSHLGSAMSCIESLVAVFERLDLDAIRSHDPMRSRVFLSKGHAASALYATMAHFGLLDFSVLKTYCQNDSMLCGHASHVVPLVEHSTGALGHGLPVAVGCAVGLKSLGCSRSSVFAIVGDGELHEGSMWEALALANHLRLNNLIVIVDNNKISSITKTNEVINMDPLKNRFEGFGFLVHEIDGHDLLALRNALTLANQADHPSVIIANTVKGYGVPFAENQPIWHYRSLNNETYASAQEYIRNQINHEKSNH